MDRYLPPLSPVALRWVRFLGLVFALLLLGWLLYGLRDVFTPILVALAVAYILNPIVNWWERRGHPRLVIILALYVVGLALLIALGLFVAVTVFEQVAELPQRLEKYAHTLAGWLTMIWGNLSGTLATPPDTAPAAEAPPPEWTQQLVPLVREHGLAVANTTLQGATHFLSSVFAWLTVFVLIPMYAFFFLLRYDAVVAAIRDHLPANIRPTVVHFARTIDNAMANFFRGRLVVCLIVAVVSGMGWTLVGVPYGLQLGALAGLLNLVPFMSLLALPPVLLLTYLDAQHSPAGWALPMVLAMGVYMAVQALESFALTPMIESRSSGLHPITTVVVLLIGAEWAGLFGMLLAIPVASTLKTLSAELLLPEVRRLAAGQPEPAEAAETAPAASNAPGSEQP